MNDEKQNKTGSGEVERDEKKKENGDEVDHEDVVERYDFKMEESVAD